MEMAMQADSEKQAQEESEGDTRFGEPSEFAFAVESHSEKENRQSQEGEAGWVEFMVDNGSGRVIVNDPKLIKIKNQVDMQWGVAVREAGMQVVAQGELEIEGPSGFPATLPAFLAPSCRKNLLGSFAILDAAGIRDRSTENYLLTAAGQRIETTRRGNQSFLQLRIRSQAPGEENFCMTVEETEKEMIEHVRSGHRTALPAGMLCEICMACRFRGKRHASGAKFYPEAQEFGDEVQLDSIEAKPSEVGKRRYGFRAIDRATSWKEAITLSSRADGGEKLIKVWLLRNGARSIRAIKSDAAGEFRSQRFLDFLISVGIRVIPTTPYAHEERGLIESENGSSLATTRCILLEAGMSAKYLFKSINNY